MITRNNTGPPSFAEAAAVMMSGGQTVAGGSTPEIKLQTKTAYNNGMVRPDAGYDGLAWVNVQVPQEGGGSDAWMTAPAIASVDVGSGITAELILLSASYTDASDGHYDESYDEEQGTFSYTSNLNVYVYQILGCRLKIGDKPIAYTQVSYNEEYMEPYGLQLYSINYYINDNNYWNTYSTYTHYEYSIDSVSILEPTYYGNLIEMTFSYNERAPYGTYRVTVPIYCPFIFGTLNMWPFGFNYNITADEFRTFMKFIAYDENA